MSDLEAVPIDAFFDSTNTRPNEDADFDVRQTLHDAEVIIGQDVMTSHEFILYGRDTIKSIASGEEPEGAPILCIALDQGPESDDLERVIVMIEAVKGRHDYIAFDEPEGEQ